MKSDIVVIGGGAAGLMAAYGAASRLSVKEVAAQVTVLEKMPRPGRKIMITGKGRCNFTNVKNWNEFQGHIRSKASFVKPAFFNLTPERLVDFIESQGTPTVVERGDRAFPASYHSSDIVDTLVRACQGYGVKIESEWEVGSIDRTPSGWIVTSKEGFTYTCRKLIIATGGLSYPGTGSTGDGYAWAEKTGHRMVQTFPSLTALVPKGYKTEDPEKGGHLQRSAPLSEIGEKLCGIQLKNVGLKALIDGFEAENEFGDVDFTDGGIEGPVGFQISRKCVKSILNGGKVSLVIDLKPGVDPQQLLERVKTLWEQVKKDPRSARISTKEQYRILLGKLMPWELIPAFRACNPDLHNTGDLSKALQNWKFDIAGYVGYERCVVTAGGVNTDDVVPKTLESRVQPGLYFCGEVLDMDCDTGGYNLHVAFATGLLAGQSAAMSIL